MLKQKKIRCNGKLGGKARLLDKVVEIRQPQECTDREIAAASLHRSARNGVVRCLSGWHGQDCGKSAFGCLRLYSQYIFIGMGSCNGNHCYLRYTPDAPMFRNPHACIIKNPRDPSSLQRAIAEVVDRGKPEPFTACR